MPDKILNPDLYHDRTVQDWHRNELPDTWKAIDLDLMGYCGICRDALYLIESTTNPNKATSVLERLALRANLPAFVVRHDRTNILTSSVVANPFSDARPRFQGPSELAAAFSNTRAYHHFLAHDNGRTA